MTLLRRLMTEPGLWLAPAALVAVCALTAAAQTLSVPPRSPTAVNGDAFAISISSLSRADREERVFQEVRAGNVPQFLRTLVPVTTRATIGGSERAATWYVLPDYLAIGSDEDYFLMPLTPLLAQRLADALHCTMPTRKMVDAIYGNASVKLAPQPIAPSAAMTTVPVFRQHNDSVRVQRATTLAQHPLGSLVGGHKKDVIISNAMVSNLKPSVPKPVVIYGWHQLNGQPIQPLYNGHGETYADYSHGIRLVQDTMMLDGVPVTAATILTDQTLWPLLSDEGAIPLPRYGARTRPIRSIQRQQYSLPSGGQKRCSSRCTICSAGRSGPSCMMCEIRAAVLSLRAQSRSLRGPTAPAACT